MFQMLTDFSLQKIRQLINTLKCNLNAIVHRLWTIASIYNKLTISSIRNTLYFFRTYIIVTRKSSIELLQFIHTEVIYSFL